MSLLLGKRIDEILIAIFTCLTGFTGFFRFYFALQISLRETTGSEYYCCVHKITEDLKIPRFFRSVSSPKCSSIQTVLAGPSESPIPRFLVVFPFQTSLDPSCPLSCLGQFFSTQLKFKPDPIPKRTVGRAGWKRSLERKHNEKNEVFSSLLLFYQHNNNTRYQHEAQIF